MEYLHWIIVKNFNPKYTSAKPGNAMWGEGGGHLHLPPYYQLSKAKQDTMKIIYQRRCAEPSAVVSSSGGGRADMIPAQIGSCIRVSRLHPRSRQCNTHKLYCYQYSATCFDLQVSKFWQCWDVMPALDHVQDRSSVDVENSAGSCSGHF